MILKKKKENKNLDIDSINETVNVLKTFLKIITVIVFIVGVYLTIKVFKELHIIENILTVLKIILPLFIGFFIAWLFDPFVSYLQRKGIRRCLGTAIVYLIFLSILGLILGSIIPILGEQINDFVKIIPKVIDNLKIWIEELFDRFDGINVSNVKNSLYSNIESFSSNLSSSLPDITLNLIRTIFSGIGNFIVGLVIGFFLLINFNNVSDSIITLFPKKLQNDTRDIFNEINTSFRRFINGALIDCTLVFIISSLCFGLAGLKAPLLFGLFCGVTNIIPYAGPYIGGAPAVLVSFSQSTSIGFIVLISIVIIQTLEGNLIQPFIMSKSAKLHPVTVIIGLLIFGHFFGIIGMALSIPVIGACKALFLFFDDKYHILDYNK